MDNMTATVLASLFTLIGTILTVIITSNRNASDIKEMKSDIKELKDYNTRLCIVENQILTIKELLNELKGRVNKNDH